MQNFQFKSIYSVIKSHLPEGTTHGQFYMATATALRLKGQLSHDERVHHDQAMVELLWYECGRPFYRVSNDIIKMLCDVDIDVPFEYLYMPYPAFTILLETDNPLRGAHNRQLQSLLVAQVDNSGGGKTFGIWADLGEVEKEPPRLPVINSLVMPVEPGKLISLPIREMEETGINNDLSANCLASIVARIAVSICFLATSTYKLIRPDILSKDLATWLEAARKGDEQQIKDIVERGRRRKGLGHVVSLERERQLISAIKAGEVARGSIKERKSGRELTHSHYRKGYFRVFEKSGKVSFTPPTIVRPDLPART